METSAPHKSVTLAFPLHIICGIAKTFVDLYSSIRETPPEILWLAFVTYFGNLISPYVKLDCKSSEARFYSVAIGSSARTRKSSGQDAAKELFEAVKEPGQQIIAGFGSVEGLMKLLHHKEEWKDKPEILPAILHLDEMNQLATKVNISGSAGVSPLHRLFDSHDYDHPLAAGNEYCVRNAYLSMIGASTLDDFQKSWGCQQADAGFFSRLFVVIADANKRIPRPLDPDPEEFNVLVQKIRDVANNLKNQPRTITLTPDAEHLWTEFYTSVIGPEPEWNRIDTYGLRFMAMQTILREEEQVTVDNVRDAIELLQYEVAARRAVSPVIAENDAARMEELIRRALPVGSTT